MVVCSLGKGKVVCSILIGGICPYPQYYYFCWEKNIKQDTRLNSLSHKLHKIVDEKHDKMSEEVVAMVCECRMSCEPFDVRGMVIYLLLNGTDCSLKIKRDEYSKVLFKLRNIIAS